MIFLFSQIHSAFISIDFITGKAQSIITKYGLKFISLYNNIDMSTYDMPLKSYNDDYSSFDLIQLKHICRLVIFFRLISIKILIFFSFGNKIGCIHVNAKSEEKTHM